MSALLVFAPDAIVRFKSGRIFMHTTASSLPAFESDNPMLIGWLCQFARPTDKQKILTTLQPNDRRAAEKVIDYLQRSAVLISADAAAPAAPDESFAMTRNHLRLLARAIYDTASDILSLGPTAEVELQRKSGVGVERRLLALLSATDGLRTELDQVRLSQVESQKKALGIGTETRSLKLHIGCGKGLLEGWVNIDVYPAPLALNVLRGLPFASGSVSHVFVSHLLEHLYFPRDVRPFLAEVLRVLEPGGIVRLVVPDVESCIEAYTQNDRAFFASRRETWPWWPENPTRLEDFLAYAGAGPEPAYLFESHKYGYDFETLEAVLRDVGFNAIAKSSYMASNDEALRVDDVSAVAKAKYGDRFYSLFVEATKRGNGV